MRPGLKRLSVTARIALLAIALALVSNVVLVAFVWQQVHDDAIGTLRRDTIQQSDALAAVFRTGGLPALRGAIDDARASDDDSLVAAVIDDGGRRVLGTGPARVAIESAGTIAFRVGVLAPETPWASREAGYAVRRIGRYRLLNGRLLDDWEQEQRGIERALLLATLLSLALGIGGGLVVTRYVGRRLNGIARVVEDVADGDLARRVGTLAGGGDAFDRLAIRLDAMLDKVARLMGELRVVTDSLAHDLRSPIARLRSKTEAALLVSDPAQREAALGGLLAETDVVMRILSTLIAISGAEAVTRDRFARIDPAVLVEEIAEFYAPVAEDAGLRFETVIDPHTRPLVLHRELLTQAITNLIDNALRHAGSGGAVLLRLGMASGETRIQVEDHGPGIAEADREEALRRFGRLDSARSLPGAGLGLSLVGAVARLHGGRLELADNAPGLVAAIVLPAL